MTLSTLGRGRQAAQHHIGASETARTGSHPEAKIGAGALCRSSEVPRLSTHALILDLGREREYSRSMTRSDPSSTIHPNAIAPDARFLHEPEDSELAALYHLWRSKRGLRLMPSKSDFDPAEFSSSLPDIFMMQMDGPYTVRLVGERIVEFVGRSTKGHPAGAFMSPKGREAMKRLMDLVVERRTPIFRSGPVYWLEAKSHKRFEACFLPLSGDDKAVDTILAAVKFSSQADD